MSMLKAIRAKAQPHGAMNVVNGDIKIVEEIDTSDGRRVVTAVDTAPQGPSVRPKYKPIDPAARTQLDAETRAAAAAKANPPPSNNFDLVGDDMGASPAQRDAAAKTGRPRLYPTDADRQRAYRERQKQRNSRA